MNTLTYWEKNCTQCKKKCMGHRTKEFVSDETEHCLCAFQQKRGVEKIVLYEEGRPARCFLKSGPYWFVMEALPVEQETAELHF